jgi:hypothetical protein
MLQHNDAKEDTYESDCFEWMFSVVMCARAHHKKTSMALVRERTIPTERLKVNA